MPLHTSPLYITHLIRALRPSHRLLTTSASLPPSLPTIPTCPPSTCLCAATPEGLAIDHQRSLKGTMPPYAQHVVIRSGREDWSSRIEDEPSTLGAPVGGSNLARTLKGLVGKGGKFHDPSHPIMISNSSRPRGSRVSPGSKHNGLQIYPNFHALQIYPQNLLFPLLPDVPEVIEDFAWRFLSPERREYDRGRWAYRRKFKDGKPLPQNKVMTTKRKHIVWKTMANPTILICGHMSRDSRCGILGPVLKAEFEKEIWRIVKNSPLHPFFRSGEDEQGPKHPLKYASVSLCSHVGGHAFAGNVIIYFPDDFRLLEGRGLSPLAGKSVWYGRVEPRHVGGIVDETILGGKIIEELSRGVNVFPSYMPPERTDSGDFKYSEGKYIVSW